MNKKVLILGVGNYLMGDEGMGVHFARQLSNELHDELIDVVDGGTGGFALMELFETYPTVILADATLDQRPAGTIRTYSTEIFCRLPQGHEHTRNRIKRCGGVTDPAGQTSSALFVRGLDRKSTASQH